MDNIQEKIAEIMADPQALKQVQSLGKMLGLDNSAGNDTQKSGQSENLLNNIVNKTVNNKGLGLSDNFSPEIMGKVMKLMPVFQQMNQEDDVTRLLQALRPFLSQDKCKKLESAKKMLQVMKIIPLLKEGGLIDLGFL